MDLSSDLHPQVNLIFGGKNEGRETEVVDAENFIAKKGLAAKGKKCSPLELASVEFGEPLHYPEDEVQTAPEEEAAEAEIEEESAPIEQTQQATELLQDGEGEGPVDMEDWEPTLF